MDIEKVREAIQKERKYGGQMLVALPIEVYNGRQYAIEHRHKTRSGQDRLDAYDITSFNEIEREGLRAARFNAAMEPVEGGDHIVVIWPDEGHTTAITQNGGERWITTWAVSLSADPDLKQELMDELEASVEAGGSLFW
jgi:hypothetical protein